ncbi:MAG TPA: hypothetical protein VHG71_10790 [Verrucomicrobiae bacterium]|nr:hypothetical protein [Verrucomicrobiae bacterium]
MKRILSISFSILLLSSIVSFSQEKMSVEKFQQIVTTQGDNIPLSEKLAIFPFWTNSKASVFLKYEDGKTFTEDDVQTAKTINGKYIVFTTQSQFYKKPMDSIVMYDENASSFKILAVYGDTIVEGTIVLDSEKKTYKTSSAYGDGFTEVGSGSYSDKENSEKTLVYKNGALFMTREVKSLPIVK